MLHTADVFSPELNPLPSETFKGLLQWSIPTSRCCHHLANGNGVFPSMLLQGGAVVFLLMCCVWLTSNTALSKMAQKPWFRSHQTIMYTLYPLVKYPGGSCCMHKIFYLSHEPCSSLSITIGLKLTLRFTVVQWAFHFLKLSLLWSEGFPALCKVLIIFSQALLLNLFMS